MIDLEPKRKFQREIGKRLAYIVTRSGWLKKDFAEKMGITPSHVSKYFSGEYDPLNLIDKLEKEGVNSDWLLTGKGNVFASGGISEYVSEPDINEIPYQLEYKIFGSIPAGRAEIVDLTDWIQTMVLNYHPDEHALLVVDEEFGYSMAPVIQPGDVCLFSFKDKPIGGRPVAAKWDATKGALKIVNFLRDDSSMVALTSSNTAEPPIFLKKKNVQLFKIVAFFLTGKGSTA